MIPNYQKKEHSGLVKLLREADELVNQGRREVLRRKLGRELQETHNSLMAHVQVVKKLEKRGISLIRRLNVVNERVVM